VRRGSGSESTIEINGQGRAGSDFELNHAGEVEISVFVPG